MVSFAQQTSSFIISVLHFLISMGSIYGLYCLTIFAFTAKPIDEDKHSDEDKSYTVSNFNKNKILLSKLTVGLLWFQIALALIGVLLKALV